MAVIEKVNQIDDLALFEILRNPVLAGEFIHNVDKLAHESKFRWTDYQREFVADFNSYISLCCARSVGKTEALTGILLWALIWNLLPDPQDFLLYTVPNKVHLEPVFNRLIRSFRSNSFLKCFIEKRGGINSSEYSIRLLNHAVLICRIAGQSGTGANVIGLHSSFEILDESGYYPWGTWLELQPTLNTFTQGFKQYVSGVPTGLRENNVCYHADMENSSFSKHRISALQNPRFSDDDKQRAIDQYGGDDTDDYIHLVLGEHGKPIFSLFDRSLFDITSYPVYKLIINGNDYGDDLTLYHNKLALFPGVDSRSDVIMGIDLGYTEPSAIIIVTVDNHGRFRFHGRIRLDKVSLGIQDRLIDYLDTRFKPVMIGIDASGVGKGIVQRLLDAVEYTHKNYHKVIVPIVFNQDIVLGKSADGEDIKQKAKPLGITILQEYSNNHKIIYSSMDLEMVTELERMTYSKTPTGEIIYRTLTERGGKRGEDHFSSALMCAVLGYYLKNESLDLYRQQKKLASPKWYVGY